MLLDNKIAATLNLKQYHAMILDKFTKYQKTQDAGLLYDIQCMVDHVGMKFEIVSDDGHKITFKPKEEAHIVETKKGIDGLKRTDGGIILPH